MADEEQVEGSAEGSTSLPMEGAQGSNGTVEGQTTQTDPAAQTQGVSEAARLQKRIQDLEAINAKAQSERDKARAEAEKLRDETLSQLTAAVTAKSKPTKEDADAKYQEVRRQFAEASDEERFDMLYGDFNAREDDLRKAHEERIAALKAELDAVRSETVKVRTDFDPAYVGRKALVDGIMEDLGLDRVSAMKVADKYHKDAVQPRPSPTAGSGSQTAMAGTPQRLTGAEVTDQDKADLAAIYGCPADKLPQRVIDRYARTKAQHLQLAR